MNLAKKSIQSLVISYKYAWNISKWSLMAVSFSRVILGLVPLLSIWLLENLLDSMATSLSGDKVFYVAIIIYLVAMASVTFFSFAFNKITEIIKKILQYKFDLDVKGNLLTGAQKVPYMEFEDSVFQNRFIRALTGQKSMLNLIDSSTSILQALISLMSLMWYLVNVSYLFGILLFILVIPLTVLDITYGKQRFNLSRILVEKGREEGYYESLLVSRESLKELRMNNLEPFFVDKWKQKFQENHKEKIKQEIKQTKWLVLSNIILWGSFIGSGSYVLFLTVRGQLTIGVFTAVIQGVQKLQGVVPSLTNSLARYFEYSLHVQDYSNFIPAYAKENGTKSINKVESIEARDLSFQYRNQTIPTIKNINFRITPEKKIAIIGENGAGKTTLVKCLAGLYETTDMITLNDSLDISEVVQNQYRARLSVLFQDFNKYELDAASNIASSNIEQLSNDEKIEKYAKCTGIHTYLNTLKARYSTTLGRLFKGGQELSGGQWQKVAISRALFKEGDFIFLDEPTSALDPESEFKVIKNLLKEVQDKGVVYITHRLNVAMLADEIVLMGEGEIKERGTHEELLNLKGSYFELYNMQMKQMTISRGGAFIG
ncbi:ATP-binding cassette domain-containing protein [Sediminibacillus dalangtanensis]|uniref:ATP-binding cassette domain-containing protein n=1 Tax=Sediminibacillus dalangtanensis TaxID=2729421 RepID=A0ABX7VR56_9BACI|nr:ABC transporter ATP-binding protein [Sediminibacillus dalangtanensis]QTM97918.1 ATP-binding cassette domain-containing protein [Sediminibacillus dalangtanensis]